MIWLLIWGHTTIPRGQAVPGEYPSACQSCDRNTVRYELYASDKQQSLKLAMLSQPRNERSGVSPFHIHTSTMKTRLTVSALATILLVGTSGVMAQQAKPDGKPVAKINAESGAHREAQANGGNPGGKAGGAKGAPPTAVSVFKVQLTDVAQNLSAAGYTAPVRTVGVRSQVTALMARVHVSEGQMVKKGQLMFELDSRGERANLSKAQANLARSQANLQELERQLARSQALQDKNFVSSSATDNAKALVAAQKAQVKADEATVQAQQLQVSLYSITAPITGRIGRVDVVPGSLVASGAAAAPLLTITQMDPMGVEFSLPQANVPAIRAAGVGAAVRVTPNNANGGGTSVGSLSFMDSSINANTGMLALRAQVPNPKQTLWPGTAVQIQLQAKTLEQVAVVPQAAVMLKDDKRFVYVVGENLKVKPKGVRILAVMGERVAVKGLEPGQTIVVDGRQNVRPGATVRVTGPAVLSSAQE